MSAFENIDGLLENAEPVKLPTDAYLTKSIIVGNGEVPAVSVKGGLAWALPGGEVTTDIRTAFRVAERLDKMFNENNPKYRRKIMRT
jgi:hypothetical protein